MPGTNPQTLAYQVRNGNSVAVLLGTAVVAFAQTTTHGNPFGTQGLYGIGSANPQEIQQLQNAPHITLEKFSLTASGQKLLTGGTSLLTQLGNNAYDLHIFDGLANAVILTYVSAVAVDFTQALPANQIARDTIPFLAMDILDPTGTSILLGQNALTLPTTAAVIAAAAAASANLGLNLAN
jgi:hypothetical protein